MTDPKADEVQTAKVGLRERRQQRADGRPRTHISLDLTVWMVFIWIAAFGSLTPLSLIAALLVALAVQWFFPLPNRRGVYRLHPWAVIVLAVRFFWDMTRAGLHVSALILLPRPREDAILRIRVRTDVPEYLGLLVAMTTLVPGTVVVDVDRKQRLVYLHCLDVEGQGGVKALRRATENQEARILRAIAPVSVQREAGLEVRGKRGARARWN